MTSVAPAENEAEPVKDGAESEPERAGAQARPTRYPVLLVMAIAAGVIAMFVALFLPWSFSGRINQGLAEYAAPGPSLLAWILIAVGLATTIVATVSFVFGSARALTATAGGAVMFLVGALTWYVVTVVPSVVAGGCSSNPGTLCSPATGSPVLADGGSAGFALALVGGIFVLAASVAGVYFQSRGGRDPVI